MIGHSQETYTKAIQHLNNLSDAYYETYGVIPNWIGAAKYALRQQQQREMILLKHGEGLGENDG